MKTICLLILALIIAVLALAVTGCAASDFYAKDGTRTAHVEGNLEYHRAADGSVSMILNHSDVIRSQGNATTKAVGALGTAASAALLLK